MDDGALVLHVVLWSLLCVSLEYLRRLVRLAVELFDDLGPDIDALAALKLQCSRDKHLLHMLKPAELVEKLL